MKLTPAHQAILRTLYESGLKLPPGVIAKNTGNSPAYVRQECKRLLEAGLIDDTSVGDKPFYVITDAGIEAIEDSEHSQ